MGRFADINKMNKYEVAKIYRQALIGILVITLIFGLVPFADTTMIFLICLIWLIKGPKTKKKEKK